jgi:hypothetical protein
VNNSNILGLDLRLRVKYRVLENNAISTSKHINLFHDVRSANPICLLICDVTELPVTFAERPQARIPVTDSIGGYVLALPVH